MRNYTLIQRDSDFMKAVDKEWRRGCETGLGSDVKEVVGRVINGPAPEFYVTYETAYRYVSLALRDKLPHSLEHGRRCMWNDLAARVRDIMTRHSEWSYARALVEAIDMGNAPSWYLDHRYACRLYYRLLKAGTVERRTLLRNRDIHIK